MRFPLASLACSIVALTAGFAVSRVGGWSTSSGGVASSVTPGQPETRLPGVSYQSVGEFLMLCEQPSTLQRDHDLFLVLQQMSGEDFSKAVEDVPLLVERLHRLKQPFRGQVVEAAMRRWMEVDADGALEWLGGLPSLAANDSALKSKKIDWWSLGRIFPVIAKVRPEWLRAQIDQLTDKEGRRQAIESLLKESARMNPAGAMQWLDGFGEEDDKKAALRGILSGMAEADAQAAAVILSNVSKQEGRDELLSGFVTELAKYRPSAASEWIGKMEDSFQRTRIGWQAASTIAQESSLDPIAFLEQTLSRKEINTLATTGSLWWLVERNAVHAADWAKGLANSQTALQLHSRVGWILCPKATCVIVRGCSWRRDLSMKPIYPRRLESSRKARTFLPQSRQLESSARHWRLRMPLRPQHGYRLCPRETSRLMPPRVSRQPGRAGIYKLLPAG